MKTFRISVYLLLFVMIAALPGCSDDDGLKNIKPDDLCGTWYLTNIRGWEYDDDGGKLNFNESFDFDSQGRPVGDKDEAVKIDISQIHDRYLGIIDYYYGFNESIRDWEWMAHETGRVTLEGKELVNGTMRTTITKLTDREMTTYQKDEDGETYITYSKI